MMPLGPKPGSRFPCKLMFQTPLRGTPLSSNLTVGSLVVALIEEIEGEGLFGCEKYEMSRAGTGELQVKVLDL